MSMPNLITRALIALALGAVSLLQLCAMRGARARRSEAATEGGVLEYSVWVVRRCFLFALALGACSPAISPEVPQTFTPEQTDAAGLAEATFAEVLARLDFDDSGAVDQEDIRRLEMCALGDPATIDCDLDGDGAVDARDVTLAKLWIGVQEPRTDEQVADLVESLADFAAGGSELSGDPDVLGLLADYDGDDQIDQGDVELLLAQLREDPSDLDADEDGQVTLSDVRGHARSMTASFFGDGPSGPDPNGDGVLDSRDLTLIATIAMIRNRVVPGFLDVNYDGRVDEEDYCLRSDHPLQNNFLGGLVLDSEAIFARSTPEFLVCRSDGRALVRYPARPTSELEYVVRFAGLYLSEVSEVPEGYAPQGEISPDAPLFVVGETASFFQLREVRMPWRYADDESAEARFIIDGEPPTAAVLVLPDQYVPIAAGTPFALISVPGGSLAVLTPAERLARADFFRRLDEVAIAYDDLIENCAPLLAPEDQAEALQFLVSYARALREVEEFARFRRGLQINRHQTLLNGHVAMMTASASGWNGLGPMFYNQVYAETALLIADIAKEGNLPGALVNAVGNLATEYLPPDDGELPVYLTGEGDMLTDLLDGLVGEGVVETLSTGVVAEGAPEQLGAWLRDREGLDAVTDLLRTLFQAADGIPTRQALTDALGKIRTNIGQNLAGNLAKTVVITIIKNIPKMIVNYHIRSLLAADAQAIVGARNYAESTKEVAVWDRAVSDTVAAREIVEDLATRLRTVIDIPGGEATALACSTELASELDQIQGELDRAAAPDRAAIESLESDTGFDESLFLANCHNGESDRELDAARFRIAAAHYAAEAARDDGALLGAIDESTEAKQDYDELRAAHTASCADSIDDYSLDGMLTRQYNDAIAGLAGAESVAATARGAAWAAYDACTGSSPFDFEYAALANESVWNNAASPLDQAPTLPSCFSLEELAPAAGEVGATIRLVGRGFTPTVAEIDVYFDDAASGMTLNAVKTGVYTLNTDDEIIEVEVLVPVGADALPSWAVYAEQGPIGDRTRTNALEFVMGVNDFILVPAGSFTMGSPPGEPGRNDGPTMELLETQHLVTLTGAFYLQRTEVTQAQWRDVLAVSPSRFAACGDDCPVDSVNWYDAVSYANALSRADGYAECFTLSGCTGVVGDGLSCTGITVEAPGGNPYRCEGYRLPTEAEWEYAYRAGTSDAFHSGAITLVDCDPIDPNADAIGWFCGNSDLVPGVLARPRTSSGIGQSTQPTAMKSRNAWGFHDMAGNVGEWVWDWSGAYPAGSATDPTGPATATWGGVGSTNRRGLRGGSYGLYSRHIRASYRSFFSPSGRSPWSGVRVARSALP